MLEGGYVTVGRIRRVPVRVHLATPIGLFVFTGFSIYPVVWAAFVLVILVHELGHALLVRRYRLPVLSVDINGIGGVCRYAGHPTEVQESVIAWGGVLAQAALLAVTDGLAKLAHFQEHTLIGEVAATLIAANFFLMASNLLPFPPLDGAKAWALFRPRNVRLLGKQGRRAVLKARAAAIERELAESSSARARRSDSNGADGRNLN